MILLTLVIVLFTRTPIGVTTVGALTGVIFSKLHAIIAHYDYFHRVRPLVGTAAGNIWRNPADLLYNAPTLVLSVVSRQPNHKDQS